MSKFEENISTYLDEIKKHNLGVGEDLLRKVAKGLGPSIYLKDASKVSCSDSAELGRVATNYCGKKLGVTGASVDKAIQEVCEKMGSSNRNKYRAIFYAMLAKKLGKTSVYK